MRRVTFLGWLVILPLLAATTWGEVSLVEQRLSADALIWANCCWQQTEVIGLTDSRFDFYRRAAFIGLTGHISSVASMRVYFDLASISAYDLYIDFHWPSGFGLRVGQFIPPLGFEAWAKLCELKLIEYSLISHHWKPWGSRDIGLMTSYERNLFEVAGALVNGNGRNNEYDENKWKDMCGCFVFKPSASSGLKFACRGYYGRYYKEDVQFWNLAGEVLLDRESLQALAEVQHAVWGVPVRNSFHVQAAYELFGILEPVARFEIEFQSEDKHEFGVTVGLNFLAFGDRLKTMLDYNYWRRNSTMSENRVSQQKILIQLQVGI
ncbi:hypothetical protein CH330_08695 [candidate division WOR-3 bacterium JGI_Cruoil_03_51_56]|uniref:Porin n=1 Tax=candidate division WOR-3 bacterium JGI_Cruoil_03_51_56 TaxID=1973747 RepID=A0A235BQF0_UNCW3|nr:MAG: hypothetical protein CH330_08695 [candidate division WOR-3 bacterium JGI_Cruoil_03_51_56]